VHDHLGIFDRIVLSIYTLALALISGMLILVAFAPNVVTPHLWIEESLASVSGRWTVGGIGTAFFVVSVRLIVFAFARRGGGQPVIHETPIGDVRISLSAVESLIKKVARSIKGVREIRAVVTHSKDGLHAELRGTISPEVSIPEVSEEIQTSIRQYVKRVVGVEMAEVRIDVENIASDSSRRRLD
jgi:uncharacterized alkaline shock family protein YloU